MGAKLEKYNQKRNFLKTGEPEGKEEKPGERLRFVVQHHWASRDHFDFRLEWEGVLLSWAVPKGPSYNPHDKRLAVHVEDHPLEYKDFEGTIPKGEYGGGVVMIWDEGIWEPEADAGKGLEEGSLKFVLYGRRLKGKWALFQMKVKESKDEKNWLLLKEKDEYVKTQDGISQITTSIRTGRTMMEIEKGMVPERKYTKNPFDKIDVQLAKLVNKVPESEDWLYEIKYDGYRIIAYCEGSNVRLMTRNGHDYTTKFQDVVNSMIDWGAGRAMVLDGEMIITDAEGKPDFQALQNYIKNPRGKKLTYIIFDLLALDGTDLRSRRLIDRKEMLEALMKDSPQNLRYSSHIKGMGEAFLLAACEASLEGIVGKKANSIYSGTRDGDWIKIKCDKRQEFVIGGYTLTNKKTVGISSLLLGVYEGTELVYAGRAGTGFNSSTMKELLEKFEVIKRETSPFKQYPEPKRNEIITWLDPRLVAEIKFVEWTDENQLRQASFKGLRTDKDASDVRREKTDVERSNFEDSEKSMNVKRNFNVYGVNITHPNKVIFDDLHIAKIDVVQYYAKVSERMMPYVENRILSVVRCPKGVSGSCFFKKHPGLDSNGIIRIPIKTNSGETKDYFCIENGAGMINEVQMGTLEFHTWGSRVDHLEMPDIMVFDLDPDEGMDLQMVRQGVRDIKSLLDELSLVSYLKTSGGKGYHVVIPFTPAVEWESFRTFAKRFAGAMERKWPDRYTSNLRKDKRKGKIFIDWIRNGRGATSIAPYSLRARKGAPVSMPIPWKELDIVAPDGVHIEDALMRINSKDPWEDFFLNNQQLK